MYRMEVSSGVSSSKNIIPMFSKNPRHWLIRFVIGCGQFWLLPRTAEETNDLDTQRNQAGGAFRVCDGTNNKVTASSQSGLESGASVSGRSGNERGSSRTLIIYMLSSGTSKFRRNPRASQALTAPREKCPAPVRRHAFALPSLPLARYHKASSTRCHIPNLSWR